VGERGVEARHVEFVKTFAPGVWHVVFDVWIGPAEGCRGLLPVMGDADAVGMERRAGGGGATRE